jgi:hypothetical protein
MAAAHPPDISVARIQALGAACASMQHASASRLQDKGTGLCVVVPGLAASWHQRPGVKMRASKPAWSDAGFSKQHSP